MSLAQLSPCAVESSWNIPSLPPVRLLPDTDQSRGRRKALAGLLTAGRASNAASPVRTAGITVLTLLQMFSSATPYCVLSSTLPLAFSAEPLDHGKSVPLLVGKTLAPRCGFDSLFFKDYTLTEPPPPSLCQGVAKTVPSVKKGLTSGGSKRSTVKIEETEGEEAGSKGVASASARGAAAVGGAEHAASNSGSLNRWEREGLQPLLEVMLAHFGFGFRVLCVIRVFLVFL